MGNVVLTGFMGTGKSSVGRLLASELGCKYVDLDTIIEKLSGRSIADIFDQGGEARFRGMEAVMVERLVAGDFGVDIVVSTGGGTVTSDSNRRALREWGTVVRLKATVECILKRIGGAETRPLAAVGDGVKGSGAALAELLNSREEAYADCDFTVDTSVKSIPEVVEVIKEYLQKASGS